MNSMKILYVSLLYYELQYYHSPLIEVYKQTLLTIVNCKERHWFAYIAY